MFESWIDLTNIRKVQPLSHTMSKVSVGEYSIHWGRESMVDLPQTLLNSFSVSKMYYDSSFTEINSQLYIYGKAALVEIKAW